MKKVFSIVIVLFFLAAASFAGTVFWFGLQAEQQYHAILEQTSQFGYIQLTNESFDRGFLRSSARTAVKIRDLSAEARKERKELLEFTLVHDIRHGPLALGELPDGKTQLKPVLAIIETRIELSPETQVKLKKIFSELPEIASMKNYTTLSLGGDGETRLVIPPLHQTVDKDEKVTVDWKGLTANMAFTSDLKGFTGSLSAPGLNAVADDGELEIRGLASSQIRRMGRGNGFLWMA